MQETQELILKSFPLGHIHMFTTYGIACQLGTITSADTILNHTLLVAHDYVPALYMLADTWESFQRLI